MEKRLLEKIPLVRRDLLYDALYLGDSSYRVHLSIEMLHAFDPALLLHHFVDNRKQVLVATFIVRIPDG